LTRDSYEWTPEEKAKIESLVVRWKESLALYWLALIPTYFSLQGYERLIGYIFGTDTPGYRGFPLYWSIWGELFVAVTMGLVLIAYLYSIWLTGAKKKAVIAFLIIIVLQSILMAFIEMGVLGIPLIMYLVVVSAFIFFCYSPGFLIGAAKLTKRRAAIIIVAVVVTISYIAFFAIIHWVYWLPLHPDFTWIGIQGPLSPSNQVLVIVSSGGAITFVILVAMTFSEEVRRYFVTYEMKDHTAKEIKRMKKKMKNK